MLLESDEQSSLDTVGRIISSLVQPLPDGIVMVPLSDLYGLTHKFPMGTEVGQAVPVKLVEPVDPEREMLADLAREQPHVYAVSDGTAQTGGRSEDHRKEMLTTLLQHQLHTLKEHERTQLVGLLGRYHNAFCLEEGERGETELMKMQIDTADAAPREQPVRRVPFALRQEVTRQLAKIKEEEVIQPSSSPWASTIVLLRKKDWGLRICVDCRHLNSVTKPDTFPLLRFDYSTAH